MGFCGDGVGLEGGCDEDFSNRPTCEISSTIVGVSEGQATERPTTFDSFVRRVANTEPVPAVAAGTIVDQTYEVVERLGGGGMGIVFRARDIRLGRDVALKVLRLGSDQDEDLRRLFGREARATAQLLHPNIVTLHHVGEHGGCPYLVLELLAGETLSTRLARRARLPAAEALPIVDAVLAAIAFAHERGVLHRDLKPSNVFLCADERIKVLDFGIALTLDTDPGPVTRAAGTPGYMAPEQAGGALQDVRTDVWAAAFLLVECLLGRRPEDKDVRDELGQIDAPAAVRRVLTDALSADPSLRPASANELRTALAHASGRRKSDRRRRWRARELVAAVALAAGALGASAAYMLEPRRERPVTAAEINGKAWHVNFGELHIQIDDHGNAYGVYDQSQGIQIGTFANGRWKGWWCQLPSRQPPDDAGTFELHFVRGDDRILAEGIYKYGDGRDTPWRNDFYGVSLTTPPSYALAQRLLHHEGCPGH
jgi:serine/threonine protein kinase